VPQRRALAVRDGGCAFPGCGTPSGWCDAHHIVHWNDGGPTDLDNLVLLCGHHHRTLHHTEWRVEIGPDRKTVFYPPMSIDPFQRPIGGNSPPTAA
ncbi:HNH endonuclease signature motif containing protein, partial [Rhodococcus qingshengii]|uniref:HNH endonuclease signature motif containing protein n=2 Tax=Nocardiaceae TaxID=85025 RepID=UPI001E4E4383